jgi:chondroitin AC lyase
MNPLVLSFIFFVWTITSLFALPVNGRSSLPLASSFLTESRTADDADIETVRERVIDDLLKLSINEEKVKILINNLKENGSWPDINYDDLSRTGFEHSHHLDNMLALGRAYKKPESPFFQNDRVKKVVSSALDFWLQHDFICENWWWNEMGTPGNMIDLLLIMDDALTDKQKEKGLEIAGRANMAGVGARPGGDLIQIAAIMGKQALFKRDQKFLKDVLKIMADEIKVTTERGLKPDLSFHHRTDNVISTLSYGSGYIGSFAYWIVKIKDTKFSLPEKSLELLIDYFLDGISQSMVHGKLPDPGALNREMTRKGALSPAGPKLAENLMEASSYRQEELRQIAEIRKNEIDPNLSGTRFFWHSEYFSHQRPSYFASVRMHSSRNHTTEQPHNEEGLKMHHFGDGSNFISLTGKEYFNIYPVWDWQKIPGTTVVQKPELPHWKEIAKKGLTDFVGGVSDGEYGAVAFDFASAHDPLKARKSWFFFDKEYVSLGAGINSEAKYPVVTTINQTLLNQDVVVKRENAPEELQVGLHKLEGVSWVFHGKIAYVFPIPTSVNIKNTTAVGNWRQINHQSWATEDEVRKELFTLWLDHATEPQDASYAYMVIPDIEVENIDAYLETSGIYILKNSPELQAVHHAVLNQSQMVFYTAGEITIKDLIIKAGQPCIVMVKTNGDSVENIVVSDPSQLLDIVELEINRKIENSGDNWVSEWDGQKGTSKIKVNLPQEGYAGKSVVLNP